MTLPSFVLGGLLATLFGAAFHFWRGGNGFRLLLYLVLAWAGFWGGHWIAEQLGWGFASYGPLHVGLASVGSWGVLLVGYWLSLMQTV
jgi:hypothetical protein